MLHNHDEPTEAVSITLSPVQKLVAPLAVIVDVGSAFTVTEVDEDVPEHPAVTVTETSKFPFEFTVIACVVCPLFHE